MATLEELQKQAEHIKAQIAKKKKKMAAEEKKNRESATTAIGKMVLSVVPDKDWKRINWEALNNTIVTYSHSIREACYPDALNMEDASDRLKKWKRSTRGSRKTSRDNKVANDGDGLDV